MNVKELYQKFSERIPEELRESWDNDGLMCSSDTSAEVNRVLVTLDVTEEVVDFAIASHFDLIVSHHPLIFRPIASITEDNHVARKIIKLLASGVSVFSFHTRADKVAGGVNDQLCDLIGMYDTVPFGEGFIGRIGTVDDGGSLEDFSYKLKQALGADVIKYSDALNPISRVAVVGGDGKDFVRAAIEAGATVITLCDTAGTMLPSEFADFIKAQYAAIPKLSELTLGVCCANTIAMADASAISAISAGAAQIRASAYTASEASLSNVARILDAKQDSLGVCAGVRANQLSKVISQIDRLCQTGKSQISNGTDEHNEGIFLTAHDTPEAVAAATVRLGYDLSDEDNAKVYSAFKQIAERKEKVSFKELDAIVASSAMQVPATYKLDTYVITSGNTISATAHIKLTKNGSTVEGVYIGDGSIDAAFQAIEKITGCHYELDDFQLQAVTEGREAMGQTVVKLRSADKVYSGRGISTDIVGAGIQAYLSALNKIVYEEEIE